MTALVACGLIAGEGPNARSRAALVSPRSGEGHAAPSQSRQIDELTNQVRELEREVGEWRRRAEVAEARAEERGHALDALRIANETERMALRMLTAGTSTAPLEQQSSEPRPWAEPATPNPASQREGTRTSAPGMQDPHPVHGGHRRKGFFARVVGR